MNVVAVKLTSGEELIAKHSESLDNAHMTLESARRVQLVPDGNRGMGIMLIPVFHCAPEVKQIKIDTRNVLFYTTEVEPNLAKQYLQEVTGIQLVQS